MTDNSLTAVEAQEVSRSIDALASIGAGQDVYNGRLVLKGPIRVSINAERMVPLLLKCLLEEFPSEGLTFMDVVSTSNGGLFPLDKMARGLKKAFKPYAGRISSLHRNQILCELDKVFELEREDRKK